MTHSNVIQVSDDAVVIIGGSECNGEGFGKIIAMINSLDDIYPKHSEIIIRRDVICVDIPSNAYMIMNGEAVYEDENGDDVNTVVVAVREDGTTRHHVKEREIAVAG